MYVSIFLIVPKKNKYLNLTTLSTKVPKEGPHILQIVHFSLTIEVVVFPVLESILQRAARSKSCPVVVHHTTSNMIISKYSLYSQYFIKPPLCTMGRLGNVLSLPRFDTLSVTSTAESFASIGNSYYAQLSVTCFYKDII